MVNFVHSGWNEANVRRILLLWWRIAKSRAGFAELTYAAPQKCAIYNKNVRNVCAPLWCKCILTKVMKDYFVESEEATLMSNRKKDIKKETDF